MCCDILNYVRYIGVASCSALFHHFFALTIFPVNVAVLIPLQARTYSDYEYQFRHEDEG